MTRTLPILIAVTILVALGTATPGSAADPGAFPEPCIWIDPPEVDVDPGCIIQYIEDLIPPILPSGS